MITTTTARVVLAATAALAAVALVLQFALVWNGSAVLVPEDAPPRAVALGRFFAYFTIQSNLLVMIGAGWTAARIARPSMAGVVVRTASLIGITITAVVHFFLLRPILDLSGASLVADTLLHVIVPIVAVVGWFLVGPRPLITRHTVLISLVWPVVWVILTLIAGATTGWYPYPFLNPAIQGVGGVALWCVVIAVLFVAVGAGFALLDRRLAGAPRVTGSEADAARG